MIPPVGELMLRRNAETSQFNNVSLCCTTRPVHPAVRNSDRLSYLRSTSLRRRTYRCSSKPCRNFRAADEVPGSGVSAVGVAATERASAQSLTIIEVRGVG